MLVDQDDVPGRFILTGSHDFLLMKSIRQSLAGRAAVLRLLPLSLAGCTAATRWTSISWGARCPSARRLRPPSPTCWRP